MVNILKKKIISAILVFSFIVSPVAILSLYPSKAHSVEFVIEIGSNMLVNTATSISSAGILISNAGILIATADTAFNTTGLLIKEGVGDTLLYAAAKIAIGAFTDSLVNWINNGFEGGPTFMTNFSGFLLDLANKETSLFIEGTALELLCSPWKLSIQAALLDSFNFQREVSCTLGDIIDSVQQTSFSVDVGVGLSGFIGGEFHRAGWAGLIELGSNSSPYRNYLASASELDMRISLRQREATLRLNWGSGFLSHRKCDKDGNNCTTVTPGSIINDQLVNVLGSPLRQLELADEINEIVSALALQLVGSVFFGGNGGLAGASGIPTTGPGGPVTEDVFLENIQNNVKEFIIAPAIQREENYQAVKQSTFDRVEESEVLLISLQMCYQDEIAGGISSEDAIEANAIITEAQNTIDGRISDLKVGLQDDIAQSEENVRMLNEFSDDVDEAQTVEEIERLMEEIEAIETLTSSADLIAARSENGAVSNEMFLLDLQTQEKLDQCDGEIKEAIVETETDSIDATIATEMEYQEIKKETLDEIVLTYLGGLYAIQTCYENKKSAGGLSSEELNEVDQVLESTEEKINGWVSQVISQLRNDIEISEQNVATLERLKSEILNAGSADEAADLKAEVEILRDTGILNTEADVFDAQEEFNTLSEQIAILEEDTTLILEAGNCGN